ncbi:MAG: aminopeptidase, partial [Collinsella intestinalis]
MFKAELTVEDARAGMLKLQPKIERYADLIVRKGVNVEAGQEVVIQAPVEVAPFVRTLVARAYAAGAGHVTVIWSDDEITRLTYENVEASWFEWFLPGSASSRFACRGRCVLHLCRGADPEALKGIDPAKPRLPPRRATSSAGHIAVWISTSTRGVSPALRWSLGPAACIRALRTRSPCIVWCAILSVARADGDDPESAWELHDATFEKNLRLLNDRHFDRLHYTSANGTDLWVGMTDRHVWEGGSSVTPEGREFSPNIPTEEVFTSPDCDRVDGIVYSALPLVRHGNKIDRFWLRFESGSVVEFDAEVGRDTLESILETDEGARRLGEVALISKNTPIRETGILFYDTLYD